MKIEELFTELLKEFEYFGPEQMSGNTVRMILKREFEAFLSHENPDSPQSSQEETSLLQSQLEEARKEIKLLEESEDELSKKVQKEQDETVGVYNHFEKLVEEKDREIERLKGVVEKISKLNDNQGEQILEKVGLVPANQSAAGWISVEERLPELNDEYLVVWDLEDGDKPVVTSMDFDVKRKCFIDPRGTEAPIEKDLILFWRELPESPKVEIKRVLRVHNPVSLDEFERLSYGQCIHGENIAQCEKCSALLQ